MSFTECCRFFFVLLPHIHFPNFFRSKISLNFQKIARVLLSFTEFCRVSASFCEFFRVLPSFPRFFFFSHDDRFISRGPPFIGSRNRKLQNVSHRKNSKKFEKTRRNSKKQLKLAKTRKNLKKLAKT